MGRGFETKKKGEKELLKCRERESNIEGEKEQKRGRERAREG